MQAIFLNKVPAIWAKYGFVSTRTLASWLDNLIQRLAQLNLWKDDPVTIP
jgi:dynein heavy chain